MTDAVKYGQPMRSTVIANVSKSPDRVVEQASRMKEKLARLPRSPAPPPKPPVAAAPSAPAGVNHEMTPLRRELEAHAAALALKSGRGPARQPSAIPLRKATIDEDCGPGHVIPGGAKIR